MNESASFTAISLVVSLFSDGPFLTMILLLSFQKSSNLCVTGHLNYNKSGTSWKKNFYIELKTGNLKVYKAKVG